MRLCKKRQVKTKLGKIKQNNTKKVILTKVDFKQKTKIDLNKKKRVLKKKKSKRSKS